MKSKKNIIVILGQTSTGKSDFAVEIAKKIDGEIISADSRQVYKEMNLGTGKITKKEMGGIPHYLLDVISPKKVFSVDDFQKKAIKKIEEILSRGKVPIICGGTGFYIDTLIHTRELPKVPPNQKLRKKLENKSTEELFLMLKKLDKERAENIDKKNKQRIIRAIEIINSLGKVPLLKKEKLKWQTIKIGLELPAEILKERIHTRLLSRIKKGMIKEVENLHKKGISWKRMYELGLEYRYVSIYLRGQYKKSEMIEKLNTEIWHFAKRQKTWFKRDKDIVWFDPRKKNDRKIVFRKIKEFLK